MNGLASLVRIDFSAITMPEFVQIALFIATGWMAIVTAFALYMDGSSGAIRPIVPFIITVLLAVTALVVPPLL